MMKYPSIQQRNYFNFNFNLNKAHANYLLDNAQAFFFKAELVVSSFI